MEINHQKTSKVLQKLIFLSFNLLFFLTPFVFTWMNQELFEFSKMIFVYLFTALIAGLWLARMVVEKRIVFRRSKFDYVLLAFLLSQTISTVFSIHQRTSWFGYYSRFNGGLLSTITYITLFYAFVSNIKKTQVGAIYNSLFLSVLLISLYAIPEHFNHSPSCWLLTQKFDTNCWSESNNPRYRVFATFGQPNWLAAFLITIIPLNVDTLLKEKNKLKSLYLLLVLLLSTLALLYTKSRSGLLGLAAALVLYGIYKLIKDTKQRKENFTRLSLVAAFLIILSLFAGTALTPKLSDLWQKNISQTETIAAANETAGDQETTQTENGGTPSEEIRKIVWKGAIKVWERYPIFGSGVETFAYSYYLDRPVEHNLVSEWDFLYNKAHNELLNFLANSGAVGLLTYLAMFVMIFYLGIKQFNKDTNSKSLAILSGLAAMFISNFFGFSTVVTNLLLFGLFAVIVLEEGEFKNEKNADIKIDEKSTELSIFEYITYPTIIIASLFLMAKAWNIWEADYLFTKGQNAFQTGDLQNGLLDIQKAIKKSPNEALFYDDLANDYVSLSIKFAQAQDATTSSQLAQKAIESNSYAIKLNPVHLNFYKSQARIFIRLGQLDSRLYSYAEGSLKKAITLSPTDAKLYYNLALVLEALDKNDEALQNMEYAVQIKSNYLQARNELARMYFTKGDYNKAAEQYQYSLQNIAPNDELIKEKLNIVEASMSSNQTKP